MEGERRFCSSDPGDWASAWPSAGRCPYMSRDMSLLWESYNHQKRVVLSPKPAFLKLPPTDSNSRSELTPRKSNSCPPSKLFEYIDVTVAECFGKPYYCLCRVLQKLVGSRGVMVKQTHISLPSCLESWCSYSSWPLTGSFWSSFAAKLRTDGIPLRRFPGSLGELPASAAAPCPMGSGFAFRSVSYVRPTAPRDHLWLPSARPTLGWIYGVAGTEDRETKPPASGTPSGAAYDGIPLLLC